MYTARSSVYFDKILVALQKNRPQMGVYPVPHNFKGSNGRRLLIYLRMNCFAILLHYSFLKKLRNEYYKN